MGFQFNFITGLNNAPNEAGETRDPVARLPPEIITSDQVLQANGVEEESYCREIDCDKLELPSGQRFFKRSISDIKFSLAESDPMEPEPLPEQAGPKALKLRNELQSLLDSPSDIVRGVYEGGLKTWEGAVDLLTYLNDHYSSTGSLKDKQILELGCGSGLPGIYCLQPSLEAKGVVFQDYNRYVLEHVTAVNVLLNADTSTSDPSCNHERVINFGALRKLPVGFVAGDWELLAAEPELISPGSFDIVLTSETVYNLEAHGSLLSLIKKSLKKPDGVVLLAAKSNYFGCSGSLFQFRQLLDDEKEFACKVVYDSESNVRRQILAITWS